MNLVLTLDYEMLGSGEGNIIEQTIYPTEKILDLCRKYKIKITIFFEVVEYWKIKEMYESGENMGYKSNPADLIEQQIIKAHIEKHDIQLHLHPQWLGSKYVNGTWRLNHKYWRLPMVPSEPGHNCEMNLRELLLRGKNTIENLIKPIDSSYECKILRAGGLNIYPSDRILPIMRDIDLKADSSIFAGGFASSNYSYYDYRSISNLIPYWIINSNNILDLTSNEKSNKKLYEFPIFALPIVRLKKYSIYRLKSKLRNYLKAKTTLNQLKVKTKKYNKLRYFFEKESVMWDYCLLSYSQMKLFLKEALIIEKKSKYKFHPFILIGHSKELNNLKVLEKFIIFTRNNKNNIKFRTLSQVLMKINRHLYESNI